jgi:arginine decarboxylase
VGRPDDKPWSIQDASELYSIPQWSGGAFGVSPEGDLCLTPDGADGPFLSLSRLASDLGERGIDLPILVRCSDILRGRIDELNGAFAKAIDEYGYQGCYRGVYPIKVNQQRHVVEEILEYGRRWHHGLEAGSKPELLAVLALLEDPDALILCNGYKDREYMELALLGRRLGRNVILVIEQLSELPLILETAKSVGTPPVLGVRAKLSARGSGRWEASAGDRSKFGLTSSEMLAALDLLREADSLDYLKLLHFHLGSQITDIRPVKTALAEASRFFVELHGEGARLEYLDVGGGLGVDYDGSRTNFEASANYSLQEYANDVVGQIQQTCDEAGVPHPAIVSESGRAITAHHALLLVNVLGVTRRHDGREIPATLPDEAPMIVQTLHEAWAGLNRKNFQETFHDVVQAREEVTTLFNHGVLGLRWRSLAERLTWATLERIQTLVRSLDYVPEELEAIDRILADTYFCNFSTFQSIPDSWAVGQLFPIVPVQRLHEEPKRRGILADITCDSDGKINRFIDLRDVKDRLELHEVAEDESYVIGIFLVGAYQEILGDLHNLFGDSNAVHVRVSSDGSYDLAHVVEGDRVSEVLHYVQFQAEDLANRVRASLEAAVRRGEVGLSESKQLLRLFREGLEGYTYLES